MKNKKLLYNILMYTFIIVLVAFSTFLFCQVIFKQKDNTNEKANGEKISYNVRLFLNGANSVSTKVLSCTHNNKLGGCKVHLPKAYRVDGNVLGYSINPDSKSAEYLENTDLLVNHDMTLYVVSYQKNTVYIDDTNLDYLGEKVLSCNVYNTEKKCKVKLPSFNKEGYENKGYSTSSSSLIGYIYPNDEYAIAHDMILYPIFNNSSRLKTIEVSKSLVVNNSVVEIEKSCDPIVANEYLGYLEDIKNNIPYLLFGNKISFIGDDTFDAIWGRQYVGMNYGPRKLRSLDIRCSTEIINDYYGTMVHELAHSWDYYYSTKFNNNITSQNDMINIYNKYLKMSDHPFRDYSYSSIYEFFADMVKYYYFKFIRPTAGYISLAYPEDIKLVLEKYICIAENNYNDNKCEHGG